MKPLKIILLLLSLSSITMAHKPGFDWNEYETMLRFSVKNYYPSQSTVFESLEDHELWYDAIPGPLFNKFQIYVAPDHSYAILTFRGTSAEEGSWLENLYSAMVPAKGSIQINKTTHVDYQFAEDERAAVHAGWTVGFTTIMPQLHEQLRKLKKENIEYLYITGHSQGGALAHLCTAWLHYQEEYQFFKVKTYASASPKPGNYYFNVDYHVHTQQGTSFNVLNSEDWVPQTFLSIQSIHDLNERNIFAYFKEQIEREGFIKKSMGKVFYNKVSTPNKKLIKKYQKYFGTFVYKKLLDFMPELVEPKYANSFDFQLSGHQIIMKPPIEYYQKFTGENDSNFLYYHRGDHYLWLVHYYKAFNQKD